MQSESQSLVAREAAAAWHDRLLGEKVSEETRQAFSRWLAESAEHRAAYEAVVQAWSRLQGLAQDPQILTLRHEMALRLTRRSSSTLPPLRWAVAAVFLVAVAAAVVAFSGRPAFEQSLIARVLETFGSNGTRHYTTGTGERLAITLSDGSQVTLDTQTELKVAFSKMERIVHLTRGQAFFEVAKDRNRPFAVEARNHRLVAVGTAFDVRLDGEQVKVTMVEGTVRVERRQPATTAASAKVPVASAPHASQESNLEQRVPATPDAVVTTITAGEQLIADTQRLADIRPTDPERSTSWRRGQIIFDNTRLADAVDELNRYSDVKIELADPALGEVRLSGAFATGRPAVFVEAVTTFFPLRVVKTDDREVLLDTKE